MKQLKKIIGQVLGSARFENYFKRTINKTGNRIYPCLKCREKDAYYSFKAMASAIKKSLDEEHLDYIEYEEKVNEILFYLPESDWRKVKKATIDVCHNLDYKVQPIVSKLKTNKYEVDGEVLRLPEKTEALIITQNCKCGKSKKVLQRWKVKVSSYSDSQVGRLLHLRNNLVRVLPPGQRLPAKLNDLWLEARKKVTGVKPLAIETVNYPIDIVYTWVNDNDPHWNQKKEEYINNLGLKDEKDGKKNPKSSTNLARYRNRNELLYSLRSVYMYAPFIRKIYIVTDDQVPEWLDTESNKVEVVFHRDIFDKKTAYPVFSNRPIELNIPNINGLAEHFIYMNDDVFLCAPLGADHFFYTNGIAKVYYSNSLLDSRSVNEYDRATVVAHKNAAIAFERKLGCSITRKFAHGPFSIRLSACKEMEEVFPEEIALTKQNRFRSWNDITWAHMAPYYMLYKGYAVPAEIESKYVVIQDKKLPEKLSSFDNSEMLQTLCVNDADNNSEEGQEDFFLNWMQRRFPVKAPWEKERIN